MKTNDIELIEKDLDFRFTHEVEEAYFKFWKPKDYLDYSYNLSRITTTEEQYALLVNYLKDVNAAAEHPKFKLNWSIPEETDINWWNPSEETLGNTLYVRFDRGWMQIKYEDGKIYILKTKI